MNTIDEATLMVYVDGGLSTAERERVEMALANDPAMSAEVAALRASVLPYRAAFDQQALPPPPGRLDETVSTWSRLAASLPEGGRGDAPHGAHFARRQWLILGSGLTTAFFAGAVTADLENRSRKSESIKWAEPLAAYQSLYVRDTISDLHEDGEHTHHVLAGFGASVGRPQSVPDLRTEGLEFKRAQLLSLEDRPVLQLVYLGAVGRPVALCLTPQADPDAGVAWGAASGMDVATWRRAGIGFALLGDQSHDRGARLAQGLAIERYSPLRSG
jgi:anti-sigma factor RsiW